MAELERKLSDGERERLGEFEATIERGLATFVEVGQALLAVRDHRLFRESHGTFEAYCEQRWGMSRSRAHRMIDAATVVRTLPMGNVLEDSTTVPAPTNERQVRELAAVPEPERAAVWREVVERTAGVPTAAAVREVREERRAAPGHPAAATASAVLDQFVNSGRDVQLARYRTEFAKALAKADDLLAFPAEEVAERCDSELVESVERLHRQLGDYIARVNKARSGLRLLEGGSR